VAALIGHFDRRGRIHWTMPKGHIEVGETAEQTALRGRRGKTGIRGKVLAALGSSDYWTACCVSAPTSCPMTTTKPGRLLGCRCRHG